MRWIYLHLHWNTFIYLTQSHLYSLITPFELLPQWSLIELLSQGSLIQKAIFSGRWTGSSQSTQPIQHEAFYSPDSIYPYGMLFRIYFYRRRALGKVWQQCKKLWKTHRLGMDWCTRHPELQCQRHLARRCDDFGWRWSMVLGTPCREKGARYDHHIWWWWFPIR